MDFGCAGSTQHIQTPLRKTWWNYISKSIHLPHDLLTLFTSLFIKFCVHLYFQVTYSWLAILFTSLFRVQNKLEYVLLNTKNYYEKKRYRGAHAHHSGFTHCVLHLCCAQGVVTWPLAEHPMILMDPIHPASKFSQWQASGAWCLSLFRVSEYLPFGLLLFPSSALPAGLYRCCTVVIGVPHMGVVSTVSFGQPVMGCAPCATAVGS